MRVVHSISNNNLRLSLRLRKPLILATLLLSASLSSTSFAKNENTYGPIKQGESLWEIAKLLDKNDSISIHQLSSAIYALNPAAFQSGNMNRLKAGAILKIPDNETVVSTSSKDAKKQLVKHGHELDLLQANASQLKKARVNLKKQKLKVKKLQKKLGKYKHKSKAWNKAYRKLVASKRDYSKAKTRVVNLRKLLREKAQLKIVKSTEVETAPSETVVKKIAPETVSETVSKTEVASEKNLDKKNKAKNETTKKTTSTVAANTSINKVDERLSTIQDSLKNIGQSNSQLISKIAELSSLNERVQILEKELGNNDKLVQDLKASLETAQQMMQQQSQNNAKLLENFEQFEVSIKTASQAVVSNENKVITENKSITTELVKTKEAAQEIEVVESNTGNTEETVIASSEVATPQIEANEELDIQDQLITQLLSEPFAKSESKQSAIEATKNKTAITQDESTDDTVLVDNEPTEIIVDTETLSQTQIDTQKTEVAEEDSAKTETVAVLNTTDVNEEKEEPSANIESSTIKKFSTSTADTTETSLEATNTDETSIANTKPTDQMQANATPPQVVESIEENESVTESTAIEEPSASTEPLANKEPSAIEGPSTLEEPSTTEVTAITENTNSESTAKVENNILAEEEETTDTTNPASSSNDDVTETKPNIAITAEKEVKTLNEITSSEPKDEVIKATDLQVAESDEENQSVTELSANKEPSTVNIATSTEKTNPENTTMDVNNVLIEEDVQVTNTTDKTSSSSDVVVEAEHQALTENSYDSYAQNDLENNNTENNDEIALMTTEEDSADSSTVAAIPTVAIKSIADNTAKASRASFSSANQITNPSTTFSNHQRSQKSSSLDYSSGNYWVNLLKDKLLIIASVLNGLILIYVLKKLFSRRKNQIKIEADSSSTNRYVSWQDRENPKQT